MNEPAAEELPPAPPPVREAAEGCIRAVERVLGVRLDYDPDALPLLDHYLERLPDRPSRRTQDPVRGLVAMLTGAYFGEVVRRTFPARWVVEGLGPDDWRIEFRYCCLTFRPVGVAWEVLLRRDLPGEAATFLLEEGDRGRVAARLDSLPPATVDDYYTFAQRLETLVLTSGWLAEEAQARHRGRMPPEVTADRYRDLVRRGSGGR